MSKLDQKMRKARTESQVRSYERQRDSKVRSLDSARRDLSRAESALSKAEKKLGDTQQQLQKEEERERDAAQRKKTQEEKRMQQQERLQRQREERDARQDAVERAMREARQDDRIGELESRLQEAERKAAPPEITVLFLGSSPEGEATLRIDRETREIQKRMRATEFRDAIFIEWRMARQVGDLIQDLNEVQPDVLHFSGHGNSAELAFEDDAGKTDPLANEQIKRLLGAAPSPIRLIVFNSCNSVAQAEAAVNHVEIAIGMDASIDDADAQIFAGQFYNSLGFGLSVAQAFEQALVQVELEGGGCRQVPTLIAADGVDPETVVLVNPDD